MNERLDDPRAECALKLLGEEEKSFSIYIVRERCGTVSTDEDGPRTQCVFKLLQGEGEASSLYPVREQCEIV